MTITIKQLLEIATKINSSFIYHSAAVIKTRSEGTALKVYDSFGLIILILNQSNRITTQDVDLKNQIRNIINEHIGIV